MVQREREREREETDIRVVTSLLLKSPCEISAGGSKISKSLPKDSSGQTALHLAVRARPSDEVVATVPRSQLAC